MTDWQQDMITRLCRENDNLKYKLNREMKLYSLLHREYIDLVNRDSTFREEFRWWVKWNQWPGYCIGSYKEGWDSKW